MLLADRVDDDRCILRILCQLEREVVDFTGLDDLPVIGDTPADQRFPVPLSCHPQALVEKEAAHWDPVLFWAADTLGAHFILTEGIVHVRQPDQAVAAARAALPADPWSLAALHVVTTVTGSALLALALLRGALDEDQVWAAAHVDEDWNVEQWGVDEEVAARRLARYLDFRAAAGVLNALQSRSS